MVRTTSVPLLYFMGISIYFLWIVPTNAETVHTVIGNEQDDVFMDDLSRVIGPSGSFSDGRYSNTLSKKDDFSDNEGPSGSFSDERSSNELSKKDVFFNNEGPSGSFSDERYSNTLSKRDNFSNNDVADETYSNTLSKRDDFFNDDTASILAVEKLEERLNMINQLQDLHFTQVDNHSQSPFKIINESTGTLDEIKQLVQKKTNSEHEIGEIPLCYNIVGMIPNIVPCICMNGADKMVCTRHIYCHTARLSVFCSDKPACQYINGQDENNYECLCGGDDDQCEQDQYCIHHRDKGQRCSEVAESMISVDQQGDPIDEEEEKQISRENFTIQIIAILCIAMLLILGGVLARAINYDDLDLFDEPNNTSYNFYNIDDATTSESEDYSNRGYQKTYTNNNTRQFAQRRGLMNASRLSAMEAGKNRLKYSNDDNKGTGVEETSATPRSILSITNGYKENSQSSPRVIRPTSSYRRSEPLVAEPESSVDNLFSRVSERPQGISVPKYVIQDNESPRNPSGSKNPFTGDMSKVQPQENNNSSKSKNPFTEDVSKRKGSFLEAESPRNNRNKEEIIKKPPQRTSNNKIDISKDGKNDKNDFKSTLQDSEEALPSEKNDGQSTIKTVSKKVESNKQHKHEKAAPSTNISKKIEPTKKDRDSVSSSSNKISNVSKKDIKISLPIPTPSPISDSEKNFSEYDMEKVLRTPPSIRTPKKNN